jgi:hypothetical protein
VERQRANSFQLAGDEHVEVTFQETSITGEPQFTFRDGIREVSRSGQQIDRDETRIGTLVTVELEAVPDAHVIDLTLLIPAVNLPNGDAEVEALAIETIIRSSIGGPNLITGALQSYRTLRLSGTARFLQA